LWNKFNESDFNEAKISWQGERHAPVLSDIFACLCVPGIFFCVTIESVCLQADRVGPAARITDLPVAVGGGEIGELLRKWYAEGTAARNYGDYYDNRDNGHSRLNLKPYPQLQEIEYTQEQMKAGLNYGAQSRILPFVVFGNSSTSSSLERGGGNARQFYALPGRR